MTCELNPSARNASILESQRVDKDGELGTDYADRLSGSILTTGGRIDDLKLEGYRVEQEPDAETVRLFSPVGQPMSYYALHGWTPAGDLPFEAVPGRKRPGK